LSLIRIIIIFSIAMPVSAKAEFLLLSGNTDTTSLTSQPVQVLAAKPNEPKQLPGRLVNPGAGTTKISPHRSTAHRFGNQIPLTFAVRQIVPLGFTVSFGRGINKDARVDWRGDQSWSAALRQAVLPLQLKVRVRDDIVHISKL
jgi:hypothetical protein